MFFNKKGIQGATFGIMDGIITILGVMWGLSVTHSKFILVIGILTAGIADSFANAAGMHVSQETEIKKKKEVRKSTIFCFISTLLIAAILTSPLIFFSVNTAVMLAGLIAIIILIALGYFVAKLSKRKPFSLITEYTLMGIIISIVCFGLGSLISWIF